MSSSPRWRGRSRSVGSDRPIRSRSRSTNPTGSCSASGWRSTSGSRSAYWHSFNWPGSDVFGSGTFDRPWLAGRVGPDGRRPGQARRGVRVPREARRPVLLLPRSRHRAGGRDVRRDERQPRRDRRRRPRRTWPAPGVKLLWGTANLFSHPRYAAGAATNPDPEVFAYAAAQVKVDARGDQAARRRELRPVGRPRGLRDAAQHRPRPRGAPSSPGSSTWSPSTSTRSASRARSSSSRSRRSRRSTSTTTTPRPSTASSPATASRTSTGSTSRPTTPRWPATASTTRWPTPSRHGDLRQHRRQPRRLPERLGHGPVPELGRRAVAGRLRDPARRRVHDAAASTSTPSSAARAWTGPTCSTPTSAGSTRSRGRSSSRPDLIERETLERLPRGALRRLGRTASGASILAGDATLELARGPGRRRRDRPAAGVRPAGAARERRQPADLGRRRRRSRVGLRPLTRMGLVLGIDVSTTATKAVLVDEAGTVRGIGVAEYGFDVPQPLWSEQDPGLWWDGRGRRDPVGPGDDRRRRRRDRGGRADRPDARRSSCSTQRTRSSGRRSCGTTSGPPPSATRSAAAVGPERLIEITGNDALTGFTAPKLVWVRDHEPDVWRRIRHVLLPKDYVRLRLTGDHAIDKADGAGTILFDLAARDWSPEVLAALEIDPALAAPDVRGPGGHRPDHAPRPPPRPASGPARRSSPAAATRRPTRSGSGVVRAARGPVAGDLRRRLRDDRPAAPRAARRGPRLLPRRPGSLAPDVGDAVGGRQPALVPRRARPGRRVRRSRRRRPRRSRSGSDGLLFLPYLSGERSPHPDPLARGRVRRADPEPRPAAPDPGGPRGRRVRPARRARPDDRRRDAGPDPDPGLRRRDGEPALAPDPGRRPRRRDRHGQHDRGRRLRRRPAGGRRGGLVPDRRGRRRRAGQRSTPVAVTRPGRAGATREAHAIYRDLYPALAPTFRAARGAGAVSRAARARPAPSG